MKRSDMLWIENLASRATGKVNRNSESAQAVLASVQVFVDELCMLVNDYSTYFNEIVRRENPEAMVRVFNLGPARSGVMLLRGRDKLVISGELGRVRVRVVQVQAYSERGIDVLEFVCGTNESGEAVWLDPVSGQKVNPDLVVKSYLGPFLVSGSAAFLNSAQPTANAAKGFPRGFL